MGAAVLGVAVVTGVWVVGLAEGLCRWNVLWKRVGLGALLGPCIVLIRQGLMIRRFRVRVLSSVNLVRLVLLNSAVVCGLAA